MIPCLLNCYLDISVDYVIRMAEVQGISDGEDNLGNLGLVAAAVDVPGGVELSSLAVLHDDVEVAGVVVDLIDLDYVGVLELHRARHTFSRISH